MTVTITLQTSALASLLALVTTTSADTRPSTLGIFTGDLTHSAANDTKATLSISLTSTSLVANGGIITAFVLNDLNNQITSISSFTNSLGTKASA